MPLTWDGLKACQALSGDGHKVNVTLCFSPNQALLAAKAGATFISPFIGRLDDAGHDGMAIIREIRHIYDNYGYSTAILAASIRHATHVRDAALAGADVATMPAAIFRQLGLSSLDRQGLGGLPRRLEEDPARRFSGCRMAQGAAELSDAWLASLAHERRVSPHTLRAYGDDVARFLEFLADYRGGRVTLTTLQKLKPADCARS